MKPSEMATRLESILEANCRATPDSDFYGWLTYQGAMAHIHRTIPLLKRIEDDGIDEIIAEFERIGNREYL